MLRGEHGVRLPRRTTWSAKIYPSCLGCEAAVLPVLAGAVGFGRLGYRGRDSCRILMFW